MASEEKRKASDRRNRSDRRQAVQPFEGADRRKNDRRAGKDRRNKEA
jgi:hypothetical protein